MYCKYQNATDFFATSQTVEAESVSNLKWAPTRLLLLNLFATFHLSTTIVAGQTLLAYEVSPTEPHPICNDLNSEQLAIVCAKVL